MKNEILKIFQLVLFTSGCLFTQFAQGAGLVKVESALGSELTIEKVGEKAKAEVGMEVLNSEVVVSGSNSTIRLVYPDRSTVLLASNTKVEVEGMDTEVSSIRLFEGQVLVVVPKTKFTETKHRFFIRTKEMVIGARDGKFVVDYVSESQKLNLVVIDGKIEFAPTHSDLIANKGKELRNSEAVQILAGKMDEIKSLPTSKFEKFLKKEWPDFYRHELRKTKKQE